MTVIEPKSKIEELIRLIDQAVTHENENNLCMAVKDALEKVIGNGEEFLAPHLVTPAEGCYARRLVHKDPQGRYSILSMVWDKGQGTALHDHDHRWCVECVYKGRILVKSYSLQTPEDAEILQFAPEAQIYAGVGEAGALIPPFEYHSIENPDDTPAVTIHVYAGELNQCNIFVPVEGGYRRETRNLTYTP